MTMSKTQRIFYNADINLMVRSLAAIVLCIAVLSSVTLGHLNSYYPHANQQKLLPPTAAFLHQIVYQHADLLTENQRRDCETLVKTIRQLHQDLSGAEATAQAGLQEQLRAAQDKAHAILTAVEPKLAVTITPEGVHYNPHAVTDLNGDAGAVLLQISNGEGDLHFVSRTEDLATGIYRCGEIGIASGTTWLLLSLQAAPINHITHLELPVRTPQGVLHQLNVNIRTPEFGMLQVKVLSDNTKEPTPALVQLKWLKDGSIRKPPNAVEISRQWDKQGHWSWPRRPFLPPPHDDLYFWCIPGPFSAALPPGEWEMIVYRGLEHVMIQDRFDIEPGETLKKSYRPKRWADMAQRGWYSGDNHVHCRVLSDRDADRLLVWMKAVDLNVANTLQMGDVNRTYFQQRGFGSTWQVFEHPYLLAPGQEGPRTRIFEPVNTMLGHVIILNNRSLIRDTDNYFLYDWVFDQARRQQAISGFAHVWMPDDIHNYFVRRPMSLYLPHSKVDFLEIMQMGELGTDLYYEFLNCGFKLTASAGSDTPFYSPYTQEKHTMIGDGRVYVYTGGKTFTPKQWFDAFAAGRTLVTNGPMLDFRVNQSLPGDELHINKTQTLKITAASWGNPQGAIPTKLQIIQNGNVLREVEATSKTAEKMALKFKIQADKSFWIAARAIAQDGTEAHTTPVYVIRDQQPFWDSTQIETLLNNRLRDLAEIEAKIATALESPQHSDIHLRNRDIAQFIQQGPRLQPLIDKARRYYEQLLNTTTP